MENNKLWFRAKRYGWGWVPSSWQGWLITLLYIAGLVWSGFRAGILAAGASEPNTYFFTQYIAGVIALTVIMIAICYRKGEKPGWHWGDK